MTDFNETQSVVSERQEPTFYARIPKMAIIDLDPYELALYCLLKQTASDGGECTKSNKTLCLESGISESKIKTTRKSLRDKGYIHYDDPLPGDTETIKIIIVDVWAENHARFAIAKGVTRKPRRGSPENPVGGHQKTPKNNQYKNNQYKNYSSAIAEAGSPQAFKNRKPPQDHMKMIYSFLQAVFGGELGYPQLPDDIEFSPSAFSRRGAALLKKTTDLNALCRQFYDAGLFYAAWIEAEKPFLTWDTGEIINAINLCRKMVNRGIAPHRLAPMVAYIRETEDKEKGFWEGKTLNLKYLCERLSKDVSDKQAADEEPRTFEYANQKLASQLASDRLK